jgi:hypothetical protein
MVPSATPDIYDLDVDRHDHVDHSVVGGMVETTPARGGSPAVGLATCRTAGSLAELELATPTREV